MLAAIFFVMVRPQETIMQAIFYGLYKFRKIKLKVDTATN